MQEKIVHDFETIVSDEDVKIVVEVMGGIEPAYTFVNAAFRLEKAWQHRIKHWLQSMGLSFFL